ncbi:MAG: enoyl-CoA hydratase/isomerase family protein [Ferruginibacter sp.]|nr:enoyl-CoA hydratase/isomerase family protein [Bacteroidota bacterium]MBX2918194.1 enoyl-CoA hydratase/isomerase family protein [Ferruginibacter sp.]MCB0708582.1 enoyl-CoA hydratase/isomerase family protein [Chitinophagaceae bacterium]MCC7378329.1 enoyl-CoA hydratase/isomerase family protein [Chitinophagaceae bacterium]
MDKAYVKSHIEHGINTIEFFHPQSNSLPIKILEELAKEIHFAGTHDETRVIVLQSGGEKTFCAGASFDELMAIKDEKEGLVFFSGFANVINAMRKCPKFIIGRIQGKSVGGGVGLAASVDYAIATNKADIKLSELAVGIGPFVVGPAVERKIGISAFSGLAIDATTWRNADWARRKGLFAEMHETVEGMDEAVSRMANTLTNSNPQAMAAMKKIFWAGTDHWDGLLKERAAISGKLVLSDFTRKAINKFKAKD